jgi:multicomponent Na+:H+ antiporter subunit E
MTVPSPRRAVLVRAAAFALLWVVLMPSAKGGDLAMGAFATACATWTSLRLLPPALGRLRLGALLLQVPRLLWASIVAGFDVARRALSPQLPLQPGLVDYPTALPRGTTRTTFATITSLLPGTVPAGEGENALVYHALDVGQPIVDELRAEERHLAGVLEPGRRA